MVSDLLHCPSSSSSNCEADESQFLNVTSTWESDSPLTPDSDSDSEAEDLVMNDIPVAEMNALVYVVGWTCFRFFKKHMCQYCKLDLLNLSKDYESN